MWTNSTAINTFIVDIGIEMVVPEQLVQLVEKLQQAIDSYEPMDTLVKDSFHSHRLSITNSPQCQHIKHIHTLVQSAEDSYEPMATFVRI